MALDKWVKIIWNYHLMKHDLKRSDCILVLGSHDLRVAERAAQLYLEKWAEWIVFSGGLGRLTERRWQKPEAELFAEVALKMGVPEERVVVEKQSTNTGENLKFTRQILQEKGLEFNSFIVVQKPYMERRACATFKKHWPDKECIVTSPPLSFEEYCNSPDPEINKESVIHLLVGDLQRIKVYAEKGFQIPQPIPSEVWEAYNHLVAKGYSQHLIAE